MRSRSFTTTTHIPARLLNGGAVSVRRHHFTIERSIFYSEHGWHQWRRARISNNGVIGTVRDSLFYDNQSNATTAGSPAAARSRLPSVGNGANGSVTLENLTVVDNRATNGGGGGIMAPPILAGSTVTIRNSPIVNNSASDVSTAASGTVNQVSNLTGAFSGFPMPPAGILPSGGRCDGCDRQGGNNAFVSSSDRSRRHDAHQERQRRLRCLRIRGDEFRADCR